MNLKLATETAIARSVNFGMQAVVMAPNSCGGAYFCERMNDAIPPDDIVATYVGGVKFPHLQECGHPMGYIVATDEGTHYCRECKREAAEIRLEEEEK